MVLRKVLNFKNVLGLTIPKHLTKSLEVGPGDYVEMFLNNSKEIIIRKHDTKTSKIIDREEKEQTNDVEK